MVIYLGIKAGTEVNHIRMNIRMSILVQDSGVGKDFSPVVQ